MSENHRYTPFYCEENIWHLAQHPRVAGLPRHAVFISNPSGHCALWKQRACDDAFAPVFWDYHVVLLVKDRGWQVWDLDTALRVPMATDEYLDLTFRSDQSVPETWRPWFRVVEAEQFVRVFASDRRHMRGRDGAWQAAPPPWPPILPSGQAHNLADFADMSRNTFGRVLNGEQFRKEFANG